MGFKKIAIIGHSIIGAACITKVFEQNLKEVQILETIVKEKQPSFSEPNMIIKAPPIFKEPMFYPSKGSRFHK